MKTRTIEQEVIFAASAKDVFALLADAKMHAEVTGAPAEVGMSAGDPFSAFGGDLHGEVVEREEGRKLVLKWRSAEKDWPEDHYSLATFTFEETEPGNTTLTLHHADLPDVSADNVDKGWHSYYWEPMRERLEA